MNAEAVHVDRGELTWADYVTPHLPAALVSPRAIAHVRPLLTGLPARAISDLYVECRLRADQDQVDVIAGILAKDRGSLLSEAWCLDVSSGGGLAAARLQAFVRRWASGVYAALPIASVWIEYDSLSGDASVWSAPSVFIEVEGPHAMATARPSAAIATEMFRELTGADLPSSIVSRLEACYRCLPAGGSLPYIGVMLGRAVLPLRVCVAGFSSAALSSFLRAVPWGGELRRVTEVLEAVEQAQTSRAVTPGLVHMDLGDPTPSALGIEFVLTRRTQASGVVNERQLLESLVGWGLCDRKKLEGLLGWPGYSTGFLQGEPWESVFTRRVNNIKLSLGANGGVQAKAYLCTTRTPRCELRSRRGHGANTYETSSQSGR